jgi:hypothetical protein
MTAKPPDSPSEQTISARVDRMRSGFTFQISVDTDNIAEGLVVANTALAAGVT